MNAGARAGIAVGVGVLLLTIGGAAWFVLSRRAAPEPAPAAAPAVAAATPAPAPPADGLSAEAFTETPATPEPVAEVARTPKPRPTKAPAATPAPAAATPPPTPPPPPPAARFELGPTLALRVKGNVKDLGSLDLSSPSVQRTPENAAKVEFEVVPEEVDAGSSFVVRIFLANLSRKTVKFKDAVVVMTVDGQSSQRTMSLRTKEAKENQRALLDEMTSGWPASQRQVAFDVKVLAKNGDLYFASLKGVLGGRRAARPVDAIEGFEKGTVSNVYKAEDKKP